MTSFHASTTASPHRGDGGFVVERTLNQPLRVCIAAPTHDFLGGQAVQARRLIDHLVQCGVTVSFAPHNPRLPRPFGWLQRAKFARTVVTELAYLAFLVRQIPRCDIIHAFSASYVSFLLAPVPAMLMGRLFRKRVVLNYHSGEAEDHLRRWRSARLLARLAHIIVVPSPYLVEVFSRFGLRAQAISNFVDFSRLQYRERAPLQPAFLTNRNLERMYNVACVLRAFARIQACRPEAQLIVAGEGSERGRLEQLAADLNLRAVRFVGRVPPTHMSELYSKADVFLNGSDVDNMPLSILDAFAAGVPVVTTRAGGIPFLVRDGETGLLVDCNDDAGLASQALRLLDDPALALRMATAAYHESMDRYAWNAVRDQWIAVYTQLDTSSRRNGGCLSPRLSQDTE